jgi:nucleotide-binding universal stress UspA family protein
MPAIHPIVASTDFSAAANRAVERAARIATQRQAELRVLHVVHPLDLYPGVEMAPDILLQQEHALQAQGETQLEALAASLRERFNISVTASTRIGSVHTEIIDYATHLDASLLVLGARGEHGLLDLLLGSTVARVLRLAACPVLIVKNLDPAPYQQVIAALDFSAASRDAPAWARTLAPDARIEIVHVYDSAQDVRMRRTGVTEDWILSQREQSLSAAELQLGALLTALGDERITRKVLTGYPPTELCARQAALPADLIVLGRHGKHRMKEWLLGSVSKNVAQAASCDVLLLGLQPEQRAQ